MDQKKEPRLPYPRSRSQEMEEDIQLLYAAPPPRFRDRKQPPIEAVYAAPVIREEK